MVFNCFQTKEATMSTEADALQDILTGTKVKRALPEHVHPAARALLFADNKYLAAQATAEQARLDYVRIEEKYLLAFGNEPPRNVLIDGTVIMARGDWYDLKEGERLDYHTVDEVPS
jgi:hypothetical protein